MFAMVGGLGTENQQAVRDYLNQQKVPQLYVSTGRATSAPSTSKYPWTIGWQPDYVQEGIISGRYVEGEHPEREDRRPLPERRLRQGLPRRASEGAPAQRAIVASQGYPRNGGAAAVQPLIAQLQRVRRRHVAGHRDADGVDHGARVGVPARLEAGPDRQLGRRHRRVHDGRAAVAGSADAVNGVVSDDLPKDPPNPAYANDPQVKLYKQIMDQVRAVVPEAAGRHALLLRHGEGLHVRQALYRAGKNPTRQSLMNAVAHLTINERSAGSEPGVKLRHVAEERIPDPLPEAASGTTNGHWTEFGDLVRTRR